MNNSHDVTRNVFSAYTDTSGVQTYSNWRPEDGEHQVVFLDLDIFPPGGSFKIRDGAWGVQDCPQVDALGCCFSYALVQDDASPGEPSRFRGALMVLPAAGLDALKSPEAKSKAEKDIARLKGLLQAALGDYDVDDLNGAFGEFLLRKETNKIMSGTIKINTLPRRNDSVKDIWRDSGVAHLTLTEE